jgi:hypothetical protein
MFAAIPEGERWGVPLLDRNSDAFIATTRWKRLKCAWVEPWPKAFQNLRASRATDLVLHHPMHVVSEWTGQSIETMKKFYLQVIDEHREAALQVKPQLPPAASKDSGSQLSGEAKQNPKPLMPDTPRHAAQQKSQTPFITESGFECLDLSGPSVAAEGLEQVLQTRGKRKKKQPGEAKPEAPSEASAIDPENLAEILADQLGRYDTLELIKQLVSRVQGA